MTAEAEAGLEFVPRALLQGQLPLESETTFVECIKFVTQQ